LWDGNIPELLCIRFNEDGWVLHDETECPISGVTVAEGNPAFTAIDGMLYDISGKRLIMSTAQAYVRNL